MINLQIDENNLVEIIENLAHSTTEIENLPLLDENEELTVEGVNSIISALDYINTALYTLLSNLPDFNKIYLEA